MGSSRSAEHSITGFLYQFHKTLVELLNADADTAITVEGIIEDIDLRSNAGVKAIQCKYHATKADYTLGLFYKPLLQMYKHSISYTDPIEYRLFVHVNGRTSGTITVTDADLQAVLSTQNQDLQSLVTTTALATPEQRSLFLTRVTIEFGPAYDDLCAEVRALLESVSAWDIDVDAIVYPNALNYVIGMATKGDPGTRTTTREQLLTFLSKVRTAAVNRWTLSLHTKRKILSARRDELLPSLGSNFRRRAVVIGAGRPAEFEAHFVPFLHEFIDAYHSKLLHIHPPIFLVDCPEDELQAYLDALYSRNIKCSDGMVGRKFQADHFLRKPVRRAKVLPMDAEFRIRLAAYSADTFAKVLECCDDVYLVGAGALIKGSTVAGVFFEHIDVQTFRELRYLMGVGDAID